MTPEQITELRTLVDAEASLATPRSVGDHVTIAEWLNTPTIATDVDAPREKILRAIIVRGVLGKMRARLRMLQAKATALASTSLSAPGLVDLEAEMRVVENAHGAFELLPTFRTRDASVKAFVSDTLTSLVGLGLMASQDATAFLQIGRGSISPFESVVGIGQQASILDVSKIMGA